MKKNLSSFLASFFSVCMLSRVRPTLCDSTDCSPPGSCVHGILQASILEWVAMPSSRGSSRPRDGTPVSPASPALAGAYILVNEEIIPLPGKIKLHNYTNS